MDNNIDHDSTSSLFLLRFYMVFTRLLKGFLEKTKIKVKDLV